MSDCIEYVGYRMPGQWNYGVRKVNGKTMLAHRAAWEENFGPIPDGLLVCHTCDNPPCINVMHLFLGSQSDNMQDMVAKNRRAKYMNNNARKTHCKRGHLLPAKGKKQRTCQECKNLRARERRANV